MSEDQCGAHNDWAPEYDRRQVACTEVAGHGRIRSPLTGLEYDHANAQVGYYWTARYRPTTTAATSEAALSTQATAATTSEETAP